MTITVSGWSAANPLTFFIHASAVPTHSVKAIKREKICLIYIRF